MSSVTQPIDERYLARARTASTATARLLFTDNLKLMLTLLVIAQHAAQPYGPTTGSWPVANDERTFVLAPFLAVNAAFFMALFFLLAGYFTPGAYDRKGAAQFLRDRLVRLGVPFVFFSLLVFGPISYGSYAAESTNPLSFWQFIAQRYLGGDVFQAGHLWFIALLLLLSVCYLLYRQFAPPALAEAAPGAPSGRAILLFTLALACAVFLVRIWSPVDQWTHMLRFIPVEPAHLPQYISFYVLGILAYRRGWFTSLAAPIGMRWLWIGLAAAVARYVYSIGAPLLHDIAPVPVIIADGGANWRALVWSLWESLICVGLSVGLLTLFRERLDQQSRLVALLAACSYAVYLLHLWLVIGLQFGLDDVALPPWSKFLLVLVAGTLLSFGASSLLRRLPYATRII